MECVSWSKYYKHVFRYILWLTYINSFRSSFYQYGMSIQVVNKYPFASLSKLVNKSSNTITVR
jgi:hypothetical protein